MSWYIGTSNPTRTPSQDMIDKTLESMRFQERTTKDHYQLMMILFDNKKSEGDRTRSTYKYVLRKTLLTEKEETKFVVLRFRSLQEQFFGSRFRYVQDLSKSIKHTKCIPIALQNTFQAVYNTEFNPEYFKEKIISLLDSEIMTEEMLEASCKLNPYTMPSPLLVFNSYLRASLTAETVDKYLGLFFREKLLECEDQFIMQINQDILRVHNILMPLHDMQGLTQVENDKEVEENPNNMILELEYTEEAKTTHEVVVKFEDKDSMELVIDTELEAKCEDFFASAQYFHDPLLHTTEMDVECSLRSSDGWSFLNTSTNGFEAFNGSYT